MSNLRPLTATAPILRETMGHTFALRSRLESARAEVIDLERQLKESEGTLRDAFELFKLDVTTDLFKPRVLAPDGTEPSA